jgi:hypothetical protein
MGTSTLRGILLVAAVLIGVLMISRAFASDATSALRLPVGSTASPSPSVSTSPSVSPSTSPSPKLTKKTAVKGVPIQILNGTAVAGLGAQVGVSLKSQGYTVVGAPANAGNPNFTTTTIYYEAGAKDLAQFMQQHYLQGAKLKRATASQFSAPVKLTVIVGTDRSSSSG